MSHVTLLVHYGSANVDGFAVDRRHAMNRLEIDFRRLWDAMVRRSTAKDSKSFQSNLSDDDLSAATTKDALVADSVRTNVVNDAEVYLRRLT